MGLAGLRCASMPFADEVMFNLWPGVAAGWLRALGGRLVVMDRILARAAGQAPWTDDEERSGEGAPVGSEGSSGGGSGRSGRSGSTRGRRQAKMRPAERARRRRTGERGGCGSCQMPS